MIRNSKRSLSRDLVRFLQYIDACAVKRYELISKSAINVSFMGRPQGFGVAEDRTIEKLRNRMEKVFVTSGGDEDNNAELEELDFMTDDGEDVPIIVKRKIGSSKSTTEALMKGNVEKPPVRKSMVFDSNRIVYQVYGNTHDLSSSAEDDSVDGGEEIAMISRDSGIRPSSKTRKMVLVKGSGGKNRVVKTVSFDENGNVYKVYGDTTESSISEEDDSTSGSNDENGEEKGNGNGVEEIKYVPKENEGFEGEEDEETHSENEVSSSEGSEGDAIVAKNANHAERNEHKREIQLQKGSLMFSPPLPLKMEP